MYSFTGSQITKKCVQIQTLWMKMATITLFFAEASIKNTKHNLFAYYPVENTKTFCRSPNRKYQKHCEFADLQIENTKNN